MQGGGPAQQPTNRPPGGKCVQLTFLFLTIGNQCDI